MQRLIDFLRMLLPQQLVNSNGRDAAADGDHQNGGKSTKRIYKVVLTGGPCGGKTTGQDRLATFFESIGWKVYRVPETATIVLKGGVRFSELSSEQILQFQEDILLSVMRIEDLYVHLAEGAKSDDPILIICDRGTMDGAAYIDSATWQQILERSDLNEVEIRDKRYDQIVHLVTAAIDAENFYTLANNVARSEDSKAAVDMDFRTRQVWVGHPYVDIIDNKNCSSFEDKILQMIQVICDRAGIKYGDRLAPNSKKRKFLVSGFDHEKFPKFQVFDVVHDYLQVGNESDGQTRIRKRGQNGRWCYTHTIRRIIAGERVETRMQVTEREYQALRKHVDPLRFTTYKKRRCFVFEQQYYQLDIYQEPLPKGMTSLMILETYTIDKSSAFPLIPPFLTVEREITLDNAYSLYNLSLRD